MRGRVEFEADGVQHYLKLSTNAHVRYQRLRDETLLDAVVKVQGNPADVDRLRAIFWAAMSHVEDMTEDAAGDIMDAVGINRSIEMLSEAVNYAYPEAKVDKAGNAPRPRTKKPRANAST